MSSETHYAYGKEKAALEAVMRLHAIKRWHMIDTTRIQTLAEHSANVACLAFACAITAPGVFFGPAAFVASAALRHDMAEVFTGDIPSHTKRQINGVEELEQSLLPRIWWIDADANTMLLIKLCDLADGIRFIRLHGVDITAVHAREGLERQFQARKMDMDLLQWPTEVKQAVMNLVHFYAYENS